MEIDKEVQGEIKIYCNICNKVFQNEHTLKIHKGMKHKQNYHNKEWLENQYIKQKKTSLKIAKECNCGKVTILRYLKKYNIPRRTRSESLKGKKYPQVTGNKHYRWKGRGIHSEGYVCIYNPNHPFHSIRKYVYEHRLVMEKKIGRYIKHEERIHHINEIKDDNRIENLYLCKNISDHAKLHKQLERVALELFRSAKFGKIKFDNDIGEYYIIFE